MRRGSNISLDSDRPLPLPRSRRKAHLPTAFEFHKKWIWKSFFQKFKALVPLRYNRGMKIKEQWELDDSNVNLKDKSEKVNLLHHTDRMYISFVCMVLIIYSSLLWLQSLKEIFQIIYIPTWVLTLTIVTVLIDMAIELHTSKIVDDVEYVRLDNIREIYFESSAKYDIIILTTAVIMFFYVTGQLVSILFTVMSVYALCKKISKKYRAFKAYCTNVAMFHELRILELFGFMLLMGHIFSLFLYGAARVSHKYGQSINWVIKNRIETTAWYTRYIYSLYWAITTMTTVGYGDISGTNQYQFVVCIVVEILGAALVGFMINVIGMTLSDMKKSRAQLEEDMFTLKKLAKSNSLSQSLTCRIQKHIQNVHLAQSSITMEEEQRLFDKMDPRLRQEVLHDSNVRVVQKNIFLLSQFTKNFRDHIAVKLTKRIFQPNEQLQHRTMGVLMVDKGIVEVFCSKKHNNKQNFKIIRTIKDNGRKSTNNFYGLAEVMCRRKLNIFAKTKTFSVAYELSQEDLMATLQDNPLDYQSYCQLRDAVVSLNQPEQFQGQLLASAKHHYIPNKFFIIKKHNFSQKQTRSQYRRRGKKLVSQYNIVDQSLQLLSIDDVIQPAPQSTLLLRSRNNYPIGSTRRDLHNIESMKAILKKPEAQEFLIDLDIVKSFENYYPKGNFNNIASRYYYWIVCQTQTQTHM